MTVKEVLKDKILETAPTMITTFNSEPAVLHLTGSTMIVGDIHGSLESLMLIVDAWEASGHDNLLCLGDYVDRGMHGLECLTIQFNLKLKHPDRVFLLRGNHEDANMNVNYGFFEEAGFDEKFLMKMHNLFETMPIAAVLENTVFCVHGGLTGDDDLNYISKNNSFQYLWNDPCHESGITDSGRGEGIKRFGEDIVDKFLVSNGLRCIIRSHEYCENGYQKWFNGKLLTIFSTLSYCGRQNKASFAVYKEKKLSLFLYDSE